MRAVICSEFGPPEALVIGDFPAPEPGPGQVRIAVAAAGVSYVDALMIRDLHQNKHPLPFVPGMEATGTVTAVGPGARFAVGDRVAALLWDGGYAEVAVADESETFTLPEELDDVTVAAALSVYLTAGLALRVRAGLRPGETLLVLGAAGGTGLAAVDLGREIGARVIAAASSPERLALAAAAGAEVLIDYSREELRTALKRHAPDGVDVVFDPVAGACFAPANGALAWNGRYLVVGFAGGEIPAFAANRLLVKNRSALGFSIRHYRRSATDLLQAEAARQFASFAAGTLRPHVSAVGDLDDVPAMLRRIMDRQAVGKMAVTP